MRFSSLASITLVAMVAGMSPAHGLEVMSTDSSKLEVGAQMQVQGSGQLLEDPHRDDMRAYLFLKQARFYVAGEQSDWRYRLSFALGGEAEVKAPTPGIALSLLDMYVDVPVRLLPNTYLRVGQFKVPYSRERLADSGSLFYGDRSLNNVGFRVGRDVGATLFTKQGSLVGGVGVFTGGGTSIPIRDLPLELGTPLLVARVGFDNGVDADVFAQQEIRREPAKKVQTAVFLNGLYAKDSLVGHSTVFNTKPSEKPLYMNGNWNPLLGARPFDLGAMWQVGADAVVRAPVGKGTGSAEVEVNYGSYENGAGNVELIGGRGQVAWELAPVEVALRYSVLLPDDRFKVEGRSIAGSDPIHQVTPAITYTFAKSGARLVADLPLHFGAPVITEAGIGNYLLTQQVDQTSYLKGENPGEVSRKNVIGARLMLQATF